MDVWFSSGYIYQSEVADMVHAPNLEEAGNLSSQGWCEEA